MERCYLLVNYEAGSSHGEPARIAEIMILPVPGAEPLGSLP
jgi:hypothetical protein